MKGNLNLKDFEKQLKCSSFLFENFNSSNEVNLWILQSFLHLVPFSKEMINLIKKNNFIESLMKLVHLFLNQNVNENLEPTIVTTCYIIATLTNHIETKDILYLLNSQSIFYRVILKCFEFERICNYSSSIISNLFVGPDSIQKNRVDPKDLIRIFIRIITEHTNTNTIEMAISALGNISCHICKIKKKKIFIKF